MANTEIIAELLETTANACNCFIKSEMALNDGDVVNSQKYSKKDETQNYSPFILSSDAMSYCLDNVKTMRKGHAEPTVWRETRRRR